MSDYDGESTSARLRRVEQERDEALLNANRMAKAHIKLLDRCIRVEAELASARAELDLLRYSGWVVSPDGGHTCTECRQEIRRGESYAVNTIGATHKHVFCPTEGGPRCLT